MEKQTPEEIENAEGWFEDLVWDATRLLHGSEKDVVEEALRKEKDAVCENFTLMQRDAIRLAIQDEREQIREVLHREIDHIFDPPTALPTPPTPSPPDA